MKNDNTPHACRASSLGVERQVCSLVDPLPAGRTAAARTPTLSCRCHCHTSSRQGQAALLVGPLIKGFLHFVLFVQMKVVIKSNQICNVSRCLLYLGRIGLLF